MSGTLKVMGARVGSDATVFRAMAQQDVADIIAFDTPGPARRLTREEIEREYGVKATRPIPKGYSPKKTITQRLAVQRVMKFAVYKVFDNGRKEFESAHPTWEEAERAAGRRRDNMTDVECGKDFTFLPDKYARGRK